MQLLSLKNEYSNNKKHKVLNILGLKFKFKQSTKYERVLKKKYDSNISLKDKKIIIEHQFKQQAGYNPNIDNPKTFNEKLQWLKLYNEDPLLTICADKYLVRNYIKEKIGEEYLVPLIGVYSNADEIDFNTLPDQFVLKVNWGSGYNIIVKDKTTLNIEETKQKLNKWLEPHSNHYYYSFEFSYKNIEPKIICEKYIQQKNDDLYDYKFMCYNGTIKNLFVVSNRRNNLYVDFYDLNWNKLPFERKYKNSPNGIEKPDNLDKLIKLAEIIGKDFPFARIDFYNVNNQIYFSEITFYPGNGMEAFDPIEWDYELGKLIKIEKEEKNNILNLIKIKSQNLFSIKNFYENGYKYKILNFMFFKIKHKLTMPSNEYLLKKNKLKFEIEIETTSFCNAKCEFCPNPNLIRKKNFMTDQTFNLIIKRIKDEKINVKQFILHLNGEPLLDKKIVSRIKKLKENFPFVPIRFTTNLQLANEKLLSELLEAKLDEITVSINSLDPIEYNKIMGLDLNVTLNNLNLLLKLKDELKSNIKINVSIVSNIDNDDMVSNFKNRFENIANIRIIKLGQWVNKDKKNNCPVKNNLLKKPCEILYTTISILSNGDYALYCFDAEGIIKKNIKNSEILNTYKNGVYKRVRDFHKKHGRINKECKNCSFN